MLVLILYESSGKVREEFRARGHEAYSCDILPAEDGSPFHIQADALETLGDGSKWGLVGMHPPCTFLCGSGIHWNNRGRGWERTDAALKTVRRLMTCPAPWYLENPVGLIGSRIRKPDQTIQPYQFGEDASKRTCLWLHRLPLLTPTVRVPGRIVEWQGKQVERWANQTDSGQNRLGPSENRWKDRSRTYPGIARAMAERWSELIS